MFALVNIMYVPVDILKFIIITSSHISISIFKGSSGGRCVVKTKYF